MLGGIAVYVLMLVIFRKKLDGNVWPWALWMIGLSFLFMFCLRGWHIPASGDIGQEYRVFKIVMEDNFWKMSSFVDPYNSCLSLNILPKVLLNFTNIFPENVFRILFPLIFCIITPITYLISFRFFKNKVHSFLASFLFVSSIYFYNLFSVVLRLDIAILFFSLIILILMAQKDFGTSIFKILFLIFSISILTAHYSTGYIFLVTLLWVYFFNKFYIGLLKKDHKTNLAFSLILIILIFGFLWYSQLTNNSSGLTDVVKQTIERLNKNSWDDLRLEHASITEQLNIFKVKGYKPDLSLINDYVNDRSQNNNELFPPSLTENFKPEIAYVKSIPQKFKYYYTINFIPRIIDKFRYFLIFIGTLLFLVNLNKKSDALNLFAICIIFELSIVLILTLPFVSVRYSPQRLLQESLIPLSILGAMGGDYFFTKFNKNLRYYGVLIITIVYFLSFSGFIPQFVGGSDGYTQLNNFGGSYDSTYTSAPEFSAIIWGVKSNIFKQEISLDKSSVRKIVAFGEVNNIKNTGLAPNRIGRNSYVFLRYVNVVEGYTANRYLGDLVQFKLPTKFLNDNKNKVYNNGGSEIFK
ncbi:DUF2206 domain-containing protein [Nanoarchaeota archaeon]